GRLLLHIARSDAPGLEDVASLLRLTASRGRRLGVQDRARLLALAVQHLGLPTLADDFVQQGQPPWQPRWAHGLGEFPQTFYPDDSVYSLALGRVGDRDVVVTGH